LSYAVSKLARFLSHSLHPGRKRCCAQSWESSRADNGSVGDGSVGSLV